jgi:hypothetical protein
MVGLNGVNAFGLDLEALKAIATEIKAPTMAELMTPLSDDEMTWVERYTDPEQDYTRGFRPPRAWARPTLIEQR